jgi:hypothetical protein
MRDIGQKDEVKRREKICGLKGMDKKKKELVET